MRPPEPDTIFAIYTIDEGPRKAIGTGPDMVQSVQRLGLGILCHCIIPPLGKGS